MNQLQAASETLEFTTERTDMLAWLLHYAKSRTGLFLVVISLLFTIATATIFAGGLILYVCYVFVWASISFNLQYVKWVVRMDGPNASFEGVRLLGRSKMSFEMADLQSLIVHDGCLEIRVADQKQTALVLIGCSESDIEQARDFLVASTSRDTSEQASA